MLGGGTAAEKSKEATAKSGFVNTYWEQFPFDEQ